VANLHPSAASNDDPDVAADVFGATDRGRVRQANEDQFLIASLHKSMRVRQTSLEGLGGLVRLHGAAAHLLVIADGVGGNRDGELASGTAIETIAEHVGETIGCFYSYDVEREHEFLTQLQRAVERSHDQVRLRYAEDDGRGAATTLTMVTLIWPRAYVVHVGDSRAYYLHGGRLRQLTSDQTAYEELADLGVISDSPAVGGQKDRLKHMLTSAVGAEIEPSIGLVDLEFGDALLLCTDGLTKHVPDDEITRILEAGADAERTCRRLVDLTLERGASDNVTVIVGRFAAP